MLKICDLALDYSNQRVLHNISFEVQKGECVALIGSSGSGKSSIINILNGLIPELYPGKVSGHVEVDQYALPPLNFNEYVKKIGVVFQNPKTQFFTTSVLSELAFSMENYNVPTEEILKRIEEVVVDFNLEKLVGKKMTDLSGGEKQRIAFASACMLPHDIFLFDEPSSHLDYDVIELLLVQMKKLKRQGKTLVIAEHRLFYLKELVDRYILLKDGQKMFDLSRSDFEKNYVQNQKKYGLRSIEKIELSVSKQSISSKETLELKSITCEYRKKIRCVDIPSFSFSDTGVVGIVGSNGSGKTTLIEMLCGLYSPKTGHILYNGKRYSRKNRLKKSFLIRQDVQLQLFFETVEKEILAQAKNSHDFQKICNQLNIKHLLHRHPQTLSLGEKQRVAMATAILSGKEWLFLDEPTSGLDYRNMMMIVDSINDLKRKNVFVIVVSHDHEFLNQICDVYIEMSEGRATKRS